MNNMKKTLEAIRLYQKNDKALIDRMSLDALRLLNEMRMLKDSIKKI